MLPPRPPPLGVAETVEDQFLRRHNDRIELDGVRQLVRVERQRVLGKLFDEFDMKVDLVLEDDQGNDFSSTPSTRPWTPMKITPGSPRRTSTRCTPTGERVTRGTARFSPLPNQRSTGRRRLSSRRSNAAGEAVRPAENLRSGYWPLERG